MGIVKTSVLPTSLVLAYGDAFECFPPTAFDSQTKVTDAAEIRQKLNSGEWGFPEIVSNVGPFDPERVTLDGFLRNRGKIVIHSCNGLVTSVLSGRNNEVLTSWSFYVIGATGRIRLCHINLMTKKQVSLQLVQPCHCRSTLEGLTVESLQPMESLFRWLDKHQITTAEYKYVRQGFVELMTVIKAMAVEMDAPNKLPSPDRPVLIERRDKVIAQFAR